MTPIDKTLLDFLVCPKTLTALREVAGEGVLVSDEAGLGYPVRDGIPLLVAEEAFPMTSASCKSR